MAEISGNLATGAIKRTATWGTAASVGVGNRLAGKFTDSEDTTIIEADATGSGRVMSQDGTIGNRIARLGIEMQPGFYNGFPLLLALLLGTSAAPSGEITPSQSDYLHKPMVNTTLDAGKFATVVWETTSTTVKELVSGAVTSFNINFPTIPGLAVAKFELIGDQIKYESPTNNNAAVQATTWVEGSPELIQVAPVDTFWIDTQSTGALASGDLIAIAGYDLTLDRPHQIRTEIKGVAGNSSPVSGGNLTGQLTVDFKTIVNHDWYAVYTGEVAKKSRLSIEGTQIGTGVNKRFTAFLPRMKLLAAPEAPLTSPGYIPLTMTFSLFDAITAPTGMDSPFPYFEIVNGQSASILA